MLTSNKKWLRLDAREKQLILLSLSIIHKIAR